MRNNRLGAQQPHDFFDPHNLEGQKARLHMAVAALDDMVAWLYQGGRYSFILSSFFHFFSFKGYLFIYLFI